MEFPNQKLHIHGYPWKIKIDVRCEISSSFNRNAFEGFVIIGIET